MPITYFRAASITMLTSALVRMLDLSTNGSRELASSGRSTAHIRLDGRRHRSFTKQLATCVPSRFCWATAKSKTRSAILASTSRMRLRLRRAQRFDLSAPGRWPGAQLLFAGGQALSAAPPTGNRVIGSRHKAVVAADRREWRLLTTAEIPGLAWGSPNMSKAGRLLLGGFQVPVGKLPLIGPDA